MPSDSNTSTTSTLHEPPELSAIAPTRISLEIPSKVVVKVLLLIAVFALSVMILRELQSLLVQIAVAVFLAVAADPVVRKLERRGMGRGRAVLSVMLAAFAACAIVVAVFVPPLVEQGDRFITAAPDIVDDVRGSSWYQDIDERFDVIGKASEQAEKLPGVVSDQIGSVFGAVAAGVLGTITILFLVVFLLLGGGQVMQGTVRVFPKIAERRWWTIVQGAYSGIAAYVGGAIIIALCGGTVLTVTALLLDLPYALPLGLWMMLLEIIPMIGATIGAIPAVIVAFVAGGTVEGIIMILVVIVYQQVENLIVQPKVQGRAASLSPLIVFVSVLVGSQLLGVLGALFAVPVAGVIQIFLRQLVDDQGSHDTSVPKLALEGAPEAPDADGDGLPGVANDPSD
ncbi:MAG: family transporter [Thermoleophilia bacterium]|nr:family transporter [Thermoleophilia bacterium]